MDVAEEPPSLCIAFVERRSSMSGTAISHSIEKLALGILTKIDRGIVEKLVREAREAIDEVRSLASMSLNDFIRSRIARFSLRYSIVMVVEALTDLAVAILEKDFNERVETYREIFVKLAEKGVISADIARSLTRLVDPQKSHRS